MPKAAPAITSFNAGEWSPNMAGRVDIDRYSAACRTLENFIPLVQGAAAKRPGTRFVRQTGAVRLVPFSFNRGDSYVVSFAVSGIVFHKNNDIIFNSTKTITGATQANPVVITATAHGFSNGDTVYIRNVAGMTELNNYSFTVAGAAANTFQLAGTDGTGFAAYTSGGTVSRLYLVPCPYTADEIETLQWAGQNDVMYFACPTKPPYKLSRHAETDWTMEAVAFDQVPFSPENLDDESFIALSLSAVGGPTLTSNKGIFTTAMNGSYIKLREVVETFNPEWKNNIDLDLDLYTAFQANGTSWEPGDRIQLDGRVYECTRRGGGSGGDGTTGSAPPTHESGYASDGHTDWRFVNFGYGYVKITTVQDAFSALCTVVVECPRSTLSEFLSVSSMSSGNPIVVTTSTSHNWETGDKVLFRNLAGSAVAPLENVLFTITRTGATTFTIPVNGAGVSGVTGLVIRMDVAANVTGASSKIYPSLFRWSHGAWSDWRGYPKSVQFFEDRLDWAGTDEDPQTVWMSRTSRYQDHASTRQDDSALVVTLSAADPIEWVQEQNGLVFGTSGSEFSTDRAADKPLSPDTVNTIRRRSKYGSRRGVHPVGIENVLLFVQAAGRKLLELVFDNDQGGLVASDLTRLSEHITLGLIKGAVFQSEPSRILWLWLEDGQLLGFTYERDEKVLCWHRHPIGGVNAKVISAAVIPHPDGDGDQLWLLVQRSILGTTLNYIEYMDKPWVRVNAIEDAVFADSTFTYDGSPTSTISGLNRLNGEAVSVLADGAPISGITVDSHGRITLPTPASVVQVGLPYSATLETLQLEAGGANGVAAGKIQRVNKAVIRLEQAGGTLQYGPSASELRQSYAFPSGALHDGDTPVLLWPAGHERGARIALRHSSPLPCTVLAVFPQLVTNE